MRPIRFVAELVPPPQPPAPPPPPVVDVLPFLPLNTEVEKRHTTLGTIPRQVVVDLMQKEMESAHAESFIYAPDPAAEIQEHRDTAQMNWRLAAEKLKTVRAFKGDLTAALSRRADLLKEAADKTAQLEAATKQLADPSCLAMDPADLLRLSKQTELLPALIAKLKAEADTQASRVTELLKASRIDGTALLEYMRRAADRQPGTNRPADPDVWRRFQTGFMALP